MRLLPERWHFLLVALIAVLGLLALAACEEEEEGAPGAGERIEGGTLTVQNVEPDSLSPHFSSFSQDISLQRMLWRGLYWLDKDNVPQPGMAAELPEISEDGKTYTVTLREGLLWSDGDDLKAEDFVMGIRRTCNPVLAGEYQYVISNIAGCDNHYTNEAGFDQALEDAIGVTALDDTTLEYKLNNPQASFTTLLSLWMTFPAPVHLFPKSSDAWPEPGPDAPGKLAYNGPYVLTGYEPGFSATLAPNPNWAAPNGIKPTLDRLVIRFIDDLAVANNAYRTGELDFTDAETTQLSAVVAEFEPTGEYLKSAKADTRGLEMQIARPPLDNLDVRLALITAIDHPKENELCFQGGRIPTTTWIPEASGGHPVDAFQDVVGFDPDAAKDHLADAGFPNGQGFPTLSLLLVERPIDRCVGEFIQESFRTILNINLDLEFVDGATRSARFTAEDFDLVVGGWRQDYPDPENWVIGLYNTGGTLNNYNCSDSEIDAAFEKAEFNTNDQERRQQYKEINELIVTKVCGIGVGLHVADHYLIKPYIVGMRENPTVQDTEVPGDWIAEAWGRTQ